jgi:hypothetical protein
MKRFLVIALVTVTAIAKCQTAIITTSQRDLIPEGITINPRDKKIYVSSIWWRKIVAFDESGAVTDFIGPSQGGLLEGLGMKIDEKKQLLWVVSNHKEWDLYTSAIHSFDLKTGSGMESFKMQGKDRHLLNDLVLHRNGRLYITDTFASTVYEYNPSAKQDLLASDLKKGPDMPEQELKVFVKDSLLSGANGIACNPRGEIFVATHDGLVTVNVRSGKLSRLTYKDSKKAQWMDGIVFWKNNIIGVSDTGIMQYKLDRKNKYILSEKVIDSAATNKLFHDPTTCAVLGDTLYVMASSYLSVYNENGERVKGVWDKLGPLVVLKYHLQ